MPTLAHPPEADRQYGRSTPPLPLSGLHLQAYLAARETVRRLKQSPTPCFAREWRPKTAGTAN